MVLQLLRFETLTPNDYLGVTHTRVILSIHYVLDIRRNTPIGLKLREVSAQSEHVSPISRYDNTYQQAKLKILDPLALGQASKLSRARFAAKLYVWHRPHFGDKAPPRSPRLHCHTSGSDHHSSSACVRKLPH